MIKYIFLIILFVPLFATAQSPYRLNTKRELSIFGGATLGLGGAYLLQRQHQPFTASEINTLRVSDIPRFDRFSVNYFSHSAKKASDWILISSLVAPTLLLLDKHARKDALKIGVIGAETLLCNLALVGLTKELTRRSRPLTYNPNAPLALKLEKDARQSFFSGHTSLTAAATFATASIWTSYHPDARLNPYVWGVAAVIPATVACLRVRAGKHFLSDVIAGFAIGAASGWLIPRWHRFN